MTTSNESKLEQSVALTIRVRPSDLQEPPVVVDTSNATVVSSAAPPVSGKATTSASVIIQGDDQDAIRRANETLSGIRKVKPSTTESRG